MEDFKICIESVITANNIKLYLKKENYNLMKKDIEKEKIKILKEEQCSSIDEYFKEIKKLMKEDKYFNKLLINKETKEELL